jgi:hypothetical protein
MRPSFWITLAVGEVGFIGAVGFLTLAKPLIAVTFLWVLTLAFLRLCFLFGRSR